MTRQDHPGAWVDFVPSHCPGMSVPTQRMLQASSKQVDEWKTRRRRKDNLLMQVYRADQKVRYNSEPSPLNKYRRAAQERSSRMKISLAQGCGGNQEPQRVTNSQFVCLDNGLMSSVDVQNAKADDSIEMEYERSLTHARKMEEIQARRTKRYRDTLRLQFVRTAKKYVGRTYSDIDCCGLVRHCVHELPLFGFRLDTCNQGVMFEMLFDQKIELDEMKPGDLIFYSADYKDETKEPKRNGIVHVEIFLGHPSWESEQERSVGSRCSGWRYSDEAESVTHSAQTSGVQIYRSFRNYSSRWKTGTLNYHYCSIETWLAGSAQLPEDVRQFMMERGHTRLANGRRVPGM